MIDILKALAEDNRLEIIKLLSNGPLCVCEIEAKLKLPQNLISHHLSVLKKSELIDNCRCGKNNYYSLNKKTFQKFKNNLNKIGG